MTRTSKTFRIFVSSTFSDLKEERNALQQHVFPKLRDLCMQHGCRFQAIDLRWGVSEEASRDQQTMNICLEELRRCQRVTPRPNFLVLLGDRYGWRPLPSQIDAIEFEEFADKLPTADKPLLLWAQDQSDGEKGWYRRDDNAVPSEYCLRPRKASISGDASREERQAALEREAGEWGQIEKELRSIILRALDELEWAADDSRRIKYEASATHQEILQGALRVDDAESHVFYYLREIDDLLPNSQAEGFVDLNRDGSLDPKARTRLQLLKRELENRLPAEHIYNCRVPWHDLASEARLAALCERVERDLAHIINEEIAKLEHVSELEREVRSHKDFAAERARHFTGREDVLERIERYVLGEGNRPLVNHGESGSGKTALMAKATANCKSWSPNGVVLSRFIGATPASSEIRSLLESLCLDIAKEYGDDGRVPSEYRELVEDFPRRLALASAARPLVIFLDALDQLGSADNARSLAWLPRELPPNVKLIVSALEAGGPAGECLATAGRIFPPENFVTLGPLSAGHGKQLLAAWLHEVHRTLQPRQRSEVLNKFAGCPLPLYLKLAFEEARLWKSYDPIPDLDADIPGIVHSLFTRLEEESNHGRVLVSRSLAYLAAARHGLTEDELLDVLSADEEVLEDFGTRSPRSPAADRLPVVVWSRLRADLETYLAERRADSTTVLSFYHRQVGEVVAKRYLDGDEQARAHRHLAEYFHRQDYFLESPRRRQLVDRMARAANRRKVVELPWQRLRVAQSIGQWAEVEQLLTDFVFIEAKCAAQMSYELLEDYESGLLSPPPTQMTGTLSEFHRFLLSQLHTLQAYPELAFQQAANEPLESRVNEAAMSYWQAGRHPRRWVSWVNRPGAQSPLRLTIRVSSEPVTALAHDSKRCLLVTGGGESITGHDWTLRLWDLNNGRLLEEWGAHEDAIVAVMLAAGGSSVLSLDRRGVFNRYDIQSHTVERIEIYPCFDPRCIVSVDDGLTVFVGHDRWADRAGQLNQWDLEKRSHCAQWDWDSIRGIDALVVSKDGVEVFGIGTYQSPSFALERHVYRQPLSAGAEPRLLTRVTHGGPDTLAVHPSGKVVAAGEGDNVVTWRTNTGEVAFRCTGHDRFISALAFTPDGSALVSTAWDETLRVWDASSGIPVGATEHPDPAESLLISDDLKVAITGSRGGLARVWDLGYIHEIDEATLNNRSPRVLIIVPGTDLYVSAGDDGAVLTGDLEGSNPPRVLFQHDGPVWGLAVDAGGTKLVAAGRGSAIVWDLADMGSPKKLQYDAFANAVAVSNDGRLAICGLEGRHQIALLDLVSSKIVWRLDLGVIQSTHVAVSPDANVVAAATRTGNGWVGGVAILRLDGSVLPARLPAMDENPISSLCFLHDGLRLLAGDHEGNLWVIRTSDGEVIQQLRTHVSSVSVFDVSGQYELALSSGDDGAVRVWRTDGKLQPQATFDHGSAVNAALFIPGSRRTVSVGENGVVNVWDAGVEDCLLARFVADAPIKLASCTSHRTRIACATDTGQLLALQLM